MKTRVIFAAAALCVVAIIGVKYLTKKSDPVKQAAVGISLELAEKMSSPPGGPFELINTSFLDSYAKDVFYVAMEYKGPNAGDKLQKVFFFDAVNGPPEMEWSYSIYRNMATLKVNEGAFADDGMSRIERKVNGFEMTLALSPVEWNFQGETIERLGRDGVEMLVSLEGHPELNPFRIVHLADGGNPLAEFSSMEDALNYAKILDIKLQK